MKMNLKCFLPAGILALVLLQSTGCKREEFNWGQKIGDITYSGNVVFLGSTELALLKDVTSDKLVFLEKGGNVGSVTEMSILVIGVSEKTPYGLLRKVKSIQMNGPEMTIFTSDATLPEAIKEGTVEFHQKLLEKDFSLKSKIDGVIVTGPGKSFDGLAVTLDSLEVFKSGSSYAKLNGSVGISPEIDLVIKIRSNRIFEISLTTNLNKIDEVSVKSLSAVSGQSEIVAAEFIHAPVVIDSLVFVPDVTIKCGYEGSNSSVVSSGIRQDRNIGSGVRYLNSGWSEDPLTQSNIYYYNKPDVSDNADLKIFSGPEITLMLLGVPVQIVRSTGYLKLQAEKSTTTFWTLSVGDEGYNTIKADIFGLSSDHITPLDIQPVEIANANSN